MNYTDYIVIGSGIAGLSCARELAKHGTVSILTKSSIRESATQYAQGGIAAAMQKDDTPLHHFNDTINAGDGLCNKEAVKILVEEGPDRVRDLIEMGANFDKNADEYSFTTEGAHSKRRILHAGDATGREIEKTLGNALLNAKNVTFIPNCFVTQLVVSPDHTEVTGCVALKNGKLTQYTAKAVVLATGGCGQVYSHTTNPTVATGDGIALAHTAGCDVEDMEFIQFHPTTLHLGDKKPISIFLISEAVRGEGAVLRNIHGHRFMPDYHPDAELAPRDVVSRAIFAECTKTGQPHVYLDLSQINLDVPKRFPTIYKRCMDAKIDITRDFIPVSPAAHYCMGGVKTDIWGQTKISRLYAGGEVACVGLHGANRLASNSLLDGLVFGHRIARHIANTHLTHPSALPVPPQDNEKLAPQIRTQILALKQEIRDTMWENVSIIRTKHSLQLAQEQLEKANWIDALHAQNEALIEVQNMRKVALLIVTFALKRHQSKGSHYRADT